MPRATRPARLDGRPRIRPVGSWDARKEPGATRSNRNGPLEQSGGRGGGSGNRLTSRATTACPLRRPATHSLTTAEATFLSPSRATASLRSGHYMQLADARVSTERNSIMGGVSVPLEFGYHCAADRLCRPFSRQASARAGRGAGTGARSWDTFRAAGGMSRSAARRQHRAARGGAPRRA
jgi:hypothetical protein